MRVGLAMVAILTHCAYRPAIRSEKDNGFMYDGAIACQCAARFHLARGLALSGKSYLEHACACYEKTKGWMVRS